MKETMLVLILAFTIFGKAGAVPACSCTSQTEVDPNTGKTIGNCLTSFGGKNWCYISSSSSCPDKKQSSRNQLYWSAKACQNEGGPEPGNVQPIKAGSDSRSRNSVCVTVGGDDTGATCVFPFIYHGQSYNGCTLENADDGIAWCSTQVDSQGVHVGTQGKWGHCGQGCSFDLGSDITQEDSVCECSDVTLQDDTDGEIGKCQSKVGGKFWCYVSSNSGCSDKKESSRQAGLFWSHKACGIKRSYGLETITGNGVSVRRNGNVNKIQDLYDSGKSLIEIIRAVKSLLSDSLSSYIGNLDKEVSKIDTAFDGLNAEKRHYVEKAHKLLTNAGTKLILLRQSLTILARETMLRSDWIIKVWKLVDNREEAAQVKLVKYAQQKMIQLFENSSKKLTKSLKEYQELLGDLRDTKYELQKFIRGVEGLGNDDNEEFKRWKKEIREKVYGGCAACVVMPIACPVCYGVAAGKLESNIKKRKEAVNRLINAAKNAEVNALSLVHKVTEKEKYVREEITLVELWNSAVALNRDNYATAEDILNYLDVIYIDPSLRDEPIRTICGLAKASKDYLDHKLPGLEHLEITAPPLHQACAGLETPTNPNKPATGDPVLLYSDSSYQYYKIPVPEGSKMTSSLVRSTCSKYGMKPQCFNSNYVDEYCVDAPKTQSSRKIAELLCGQKILPDQCSYTLNLFWYMSPKQPWYSGSACGATKAGSWCSRGNQYISTGNLPYFATCVKGSNVKFQLKGITGQERVTISIGGNRREFKMIKNYWLPFDYPRPSSGSFSVVFENDNGPRDVYIRGHESQVADLLPTNAKTKFPHLLCGTSNENKRCDWLRNGYLAWGGKYIYTLKG